MIEYRTGSLFNAPSGVILAHACNAKGVWGSGIAKQFKERFPDNYNEYSFHCNRKCWSARPEILVGTTLLLDMQRPNLEGWAGIACLITSKGYGSMLDPQDEILSATAAALVSLRLQVNLPVEVHMPKINSGLFGIPWRATEKVIESLLEAFPQMKVVVWTPR